jgi:DNA-binding CsgD family transcriptional regulator
MTRRSSRRSAGRATDREVGVVAAVLVTGSEKAAAHRLGLSHSTVKHHLANARSKVGAATTAQLVWVLAPRLPGPEGSARANDTARHLYTPPRPGSGAPVGLAQRLASRDGGSGATQGRGGGRTDRVTCHRHGEVDWPLSY